MARAVRGGRTGATWAWRGREWFRGACDLPADAVRYVPNAQGVRAMATAHDFSAVDIDGHDKPLSDYAGKVLLVVNVASQCGFTPQYAGLQVLWRDYRDRGLVVLGFPCDQFGHQEPGDEAAIREFCSLTSDVDFPMFSKVRSEERRVGKECVRTGRSRRSP